MAWCRDDSFEELMRVAQAVRPLRNDELPDAEEEGRQLVPSTQIAALSSEVCSTLPGFALAVKNPQTEKTLWSACCMMYDSFVDHSGSRRPSMHMLLSVLTTTCICISAQSNDRGTDLIDTFVSNAKECNPGLHDASNVFARHFQRAQAFQKEHGLVCPVDDRGHLNIEAFATIVELVVRAMDTRTDGDISTLEARIDKLQLKMQTTHSQNATKLANERAARVRAESDLADFQQSVTECNMTIAGLRRVAETLEAHFRGKPLDQVLTEVMNIFDKRAKAVADKARRIEMVSSNETFLDEGFLNKDFVASINIAAKNIRLSFQDQKITSSGSIPEFMSCIYSIIDVCLHIMKESCNIARRLSEVEIELRRAKQHEGEYLTAISASEDLATNLEYEKEARNQYRDQLEKTKLECATREREARQAIAQLRQVQTELAKCQSREATFRAAQSSLMHAINDYSNRADSNFAEIYEHISELADPRSAPQRHEELIRLIMSCCRERCPKFIPPTANETHATSVASRSSKRASRESTSAGGDNMDHA